METNVLFLHKCFIKGGGIERVHQNLATALSDQGIKHSFFVLNGFGNSNEGFELLRAKTKAKRAPQSFAFTSKLFCLFSTIQAESITSIIAATETANLCAFLCKLRFPKLRVVYTRHCAFDVEDQKLTPLAIKLLYNLYLMNGSVVAVSNSLKKQIASSVLFGKRKIHFVPNAVISKEMLELSEQNSNLAIEGEYLLAIGRLVEQKGFDLLLKAYCLALKVNKELPKLIIAGEGADEIKLKELAKNLGIYDSVSFIGYAANPYVIIKHARAFILSSRHEGMPTVLVESLALNTPVISFDCPTGPNELITNGKNGVLVEHLNISKLSTAIYNYTLLPRSGLSQTVEHFAHSKVAKKYLLLCETDA